MVTTLSLIVISEPQAKPHLQAGSFEIVDESLKECFDGESMRKTSSIAVRCVERDASERPTMAEVLAELKEAYSIQLTSLSSGGHLCWTVIALYQTRVGYIFDHMSTYITILNIKLCESAVEHVIKETWIILYLVNRILNIKFIINYIVSLLMLGVWMPTQYPPLDGGNIVSENWHLALCCRLTYLRCGFFKSLGVSIDVSQWVVAVAIDWWNASIQVILLHAGQT